MRRDRERANDVEVRLATSIYVASARTPSGAAPGLTAAAPTSVRLWSGLRLRWLGLGTGVRFLDVKNRLHLPPPRRFHVRTISLSLIPKISA